MMQQLMRWPVGVRLWVLCGVALLALAVSGWLGLQDVHQSMVEERKAKVRAQVETALGVLEHYRAQQQRGQISQEKAQQLAAESLRQVRFDGQEYFFIYDTAGVTRMHPVRPEFEGQNKLDLQDSAGVKIVQELIAAGQRGGGFVTFQFPKPGGKEPLPKIAYAKLVPQWDWVVATGVYEDDIDVAYRNKLYWGLAQMIGIALVLLIVASLIARSIQRQLGGEPLQAMRAMQQVATGDLQVSLGSCPSGSLLAALQQMTQDLRQRLQQVQNNAALLSSQAGEIAHASDALAGSAATQSDATAGMAAAMEELTVSITHISENSNQTETSSRHATELAHGGVARMADASQVMQRVSGSVTQASQQIRLLDQKARDVSGIAAVIKDIAGQTNLLALNAAIEAARAGEQGRGFAVVADEVRKLAERTAHATVDIERMLGEIQNETAQVADAMQTMLPEVARGVELAQDVSSSLEEIHEGAAETMRLLHEVSSATGEQSLASTSIATQVEEISRMVEETSIATGQTASAAKRVDQIAGELHTMVSHFRL